MSVTVHYDGGIDRIVVEAPARLARVIGRIPTARQVRGEERWLVSPDWLSILAIGTELGDVDGFVSTPAMDSLVDKWLSHEGVVSMCKGLDDGQDPRLWSYQYAGVACLQTGGFVLGDEMGTGKTVMALSAIRGLPEARRILVVSPKSMIHRWAREAEVWFPEAQAFVLDGTKAQREKKWKYIMEETPRDHPVIVTVNWEALRSLAGQISYGSTKSQPPGILDECDWDVVIADEAHRAKDPKAQQTRALKHVAQNARWRWALTGTPVLNTPGDMWSLLDFAVPDLTPRSRMRWHDRYIDYIETRFGPQDTGLRRDTRVELLRFWDMVSLRRTKDDVLDLPPITYQRREVDMAPEQARVYRKLEKDMIASVDGGIVASTDPLSLLTRLSQAASATLAIDESGGVTLDAPSNKVQALLEILAEGEGQVAVFAASKKLINVAADALQKAKISFVRITGDETGEIRDMNVEHFQRGGARVALCTLGAGSEGINLFAADTAVFLQRSYSYGQNQQAESRVHRAGQEADRVTIVDLVSLNSVDELVLDALASKGEMAQEVLRDALTRGQFRP